MSVRLHKLLLTVSGYQAAYSLNRSRNRPLSQEQIQCKSRKENPQKLTQLSPRFHPRHLVGRRTAQKDAIKDITSDSQVNSYFPYRWSPASLTIDIYFYLFFYFYLFLYLFITRITINNGTPHLKSLKSPKQKSRLGTASNKIAGGLQLVCGRQTLALSLNFPVLHL